MNKRADLLPRLVLILIVMTACAWLLPREKPRAVLGKLDYVQFLIACVSTGVTVVAATLLLVVRSRRRTVAFRLIAAGLAASVTLAVVDVSAFLLPVRGYLDNPFHIVPQNHFGGIVVSDYLPYARPPHMKWTGKSRGLLAVSHDVVDPYATEVTFETDHEGFRNGRDLAQADLIFLGDSFTESGYLPEQQTFVHQVGQQLQLTSRNLGRAGYAPPHELIVLLAYGLRCNPRCVVWQICESNDLAGCIDFQRWVTAGRPQFRLDRPSRSIAWRGRSPTYRLFHWLHVPEPWPFSGEFRDAAGQKHPMWFRHFPGKPHQPGNHPGWSLLVSAIQQGQQELAQLDIPLVILNLPMKFRVMAPYTTMNPLLRDPQYVSQSGVDAQKSIQAWSAAGLPSDWDLPPDTMLAASLSRVCARLEVPFIDATESLRARAAAGEMVFLPYETHLSEVGHQQVAELVVQVLEETLP